jgi:hypothetical protein
MDYEVYRVLNVTGFGVRADDRQTFAPFIRPRGSTPTATAAHTLR